MGGGRATVRSGLAAAVTGGLLAYGSAATTLAALAAGAAGADVTRQGSGGAGTALLATLNGPAPVYVRPGGPQSGAVPGTWHGFPSVLPVIRTWHGWAEVRLAQRPDGSTGWLPGWEVTFSRSAYRIVINLATKHLALYRYGRRVLYTPAGVGAPNDPTPTGHFFVAFREGPPRADPGYGPFVLVTSAHSRAISDWSSSGDAVIGIHGPLGEDRKIGTTGARISHGCIRLHVAGLLGLRYVPPGSPVDVVGLRVLPRVRNNLSRW